MKTITSFLFFFFVTILSYAQRCDWVDYPVNNSGLNKAVASDASRNVFTLSVLSGTTVIQGDTVQAQYGQTDCILVKYDSSGNYLWAKVFGSSWFDDAYKMAVDASGHVYVSCSMQDSVMMSDTTFINTSNYMVLQFDNDGNFLRVRFMPGLARTALAALGDYVYMAYDEAVEKVEKLDTNMNVIWTRGATAGVLTFYPDGDLYVTPNGHLIASGAEYGGGTATFDTITIPFSVPGFDEVFIISMDTSGSAYWGRALYSASSPAEHTYGAAVDDAGNVYMTLETAAQMIFANDTLVNTTPNNNFNAVLKYDNAGNEVWGRALYPAGNGVANFFDIMVNSQNEILIAGGCSGGGAVFEQFNFPSAGAAFVIKVNPNGNAAWEKHDLLNSGLTKYFKGLAPLGSRYAAAGNFNAQFRLDCFDAGAGNTGSFATVISEHPVVDAAFSINPLDPFTFHFTDQSTGTIVTWSWSFPGGAPSSSSVQNPTVVFSSPGSYTATLVVCDGICCDSDSISILNVGMDELNTDAGNLTISPNPVSSQIVVWSSEIISEIEIYDVIGNEILREENLNTSNCKLQTSNLETGIYFVNAKVNGKPVMRKFVKQ